MLDDGFTSIAWRQVASHTIMSLKAILAKLILAVWRPSREASRGASKRASRGPSQLSYGSVGLDGFTGLRNGSPEWWYEMGV